MERRIILFTPITTMPDDTSLGYNGDPNSAVPGNSAGEFLLYNSPNSTRYAEFDASQNVSQEWYKKAQPNIWEWLGSGDVSIGVINVGDGSANVFLSYDASGNIQLRTFIGSGGAIVYDQGDNIVIGIDASYSGETNYGENVGIGDASVYAQKVGDALQFRELKAGSSQITLDVSGNLVMIDASIEGGGGTAIGGGVWITDIVATSSGNVGDKVFSSDGNVLDSCLTDVSALTVSVLALPGYTNYKPIVTINDVSVSLTADPDKPIWEGDYIMDYVFADASITVVHEDGASWSTLVDQDTPATILSAEFTGGYPGSQTELKAGDTFDVSIVTDVSIVSVQVDDFGAFDSGTFVVNGNNVGFTGTIADRGDVSTAYGMRIRVVKSTGSTSANYLSTSQGSVDGKDIVYLNDLHPTATFGTITYPATQQAIKTGENATVVNTIANSDTVVYSSPNGDLTVTNPTTVETPKTVTYLAGSYNISTPNLDVSANRAANDATTTDSTVVYVANVAPTLTVSNPAARLRSGGNDGTSIQNHSIGIVSSQNLISAPTLQSDSGGGAWQTSPTFAGGPTSWANNLQVHDDDSKGTYNWGAISGTGLSNLTSTTNSGATTYVLGGFVTRNITVPAFGTSGTINVEIVTYTKLPSTLNWSVKDLTNRQPVGTTAPPPVVPGWAASALLTNPTTINILDTNAASSSSQASDFDIYETV